MKTILMYAVMIATTFAFATIAGAQDTMMKQQGSMKGSMKAAQDSDMPVLAVIRADWCAACKKLEPEIAKLMESYEGRVKFVTLDITNAQTTTASMKIAKKHGLSKFFDANKTKSSTVGIFLDGKQLFTSHYKSDITIFSDEIDKALAM